MYSLVLTVLTRSLLCVRAQVTSDRDAAIAERDTLREQVSALQDKITAGQAALA